MENVHTAIAWYQTKIGSYDKQLWEHSVEKKLQKQPPYVLRGAPRKNVRAKTEYIDVDLIRGSMFTKTKPQVPWVYVTRKAIARVLFFPFYFNWWVHQSSKKLYLILLVLYILQVVTVVVYLSNFERMEDELCFTEVILPIILMFLLCLIHSQTVLAHINHKPPKLNKAISGVTRKPRLKKPSRRVRSSDNNSTCQEDDGNAEPSRSSKRHTLNQSTCPKVPDPVVSSSIDMEGSLMSCSVSDYDLKPAVTSTQNEASPSFSSAALRNSKERATNDAHHSSDKHRGDRGSNTVKPSKHPWGKEEVNVYNVHGKWGDGADNSAQTIQKSGCSYNLLDNLPNLLTVEKVFPEVPGNNPGEERMKNLSELDNYRKKLGQVRSGATSKIRGTVSPTLSVSCQRNNNQITNDNNGGVNLCVCSEDNLRNYSSDHRCCVRDSTRRSGENFKRNHGYGKSEETYNQISVTKNVVTDIASGYLDIPRNLRDEKVLNIGKPQYKIDVATCPSCCETFELSQRSEDKDSSRNMESVFRCHKFQRSQQDKCFSKVEQNHSPEALKPSIDCSSCAGIVSSSDLEIVNHRVGITGLSDHMLGSDDVTTISSGQVLRNEAQNLSQLSPYEGAMEISTLDEAVLTSPATRAIETSPVDESVMTSPFERKITSPFEKTIMTSSFERTIMTSPFDGTVKTLPDKKTTETLVVKGPSQIPHNEPNPKSLTSYDSIDSAICSAATDVVCSCTSPHADTQTMGSHLKCDTKMGTSCPTCSEKYLNISTNSIGKDHHIQQNIGKDQVFNHKIQGTESFCCGDNFLSVIESQVHPNLLSDSVSDGVPEVEVSLNKSHLFGLSEKGYITDKSDVDKSVDRTSEQLQTTVDSFFIGHEAHHRMCRNDSDVRKPEPELRSVAFASRLQRFSEEFMQEILNEDTLCEMGSSSLRAYSDLDNTSSSVSRLSSSSSSSCIPLFTPSSATTQESTVHLSHHLHDHQDENVSSKYCSQGEFEIHAGLDNERADPFEESLERINLSEEERHSDDVSNYNPSDSDMDSDDSVNEDIHTRFGENLKRLRFQELTDESESVAGVDKLLPPKSSKNTVSGAPAVKSGGAPASKLSSMLTRSGLSTNGGGPRSVIEALARKPSPLKDLTIGRKSNNNTPITYSSGSDKEQSESRNQLRRRRRTSGNQYETVETSRRRNVPTTLGLRPSDVKIRQISSSENEIGGVNTPEESNKATVSSEEWEDRIQSDETTSSAYSSNSEVEADEQVEEEGEERTECTTSTFHVINLLQPQNGSPSSTGTITQPDRVPCLIWEGNECKKIDLTALDIGWAIIDKVDILPESSDYFLIGLLFSLIISLVPIVFRVYANKDLTGAEDFLSWSGLVAKLAPVINSYSWRQYLLMVNGILQRFFLSIIFFFLLSVADRTFKQRLLYAKHFSYLTTSRRARKFAMPHFRLNKVRNIKIWLSLRSYLKRRGPQRSVDVIVSASFLVTVSIACLISIQMLKDTESYLDYLCNWELLVWCIALSVFLMRFMTLGLKINKKYRNLSVLITEQINLYLQMEKKPHKKEELILANNVLRLAEDLLKELESPFKISGFSANPLIYNITRIVVLSAFSAVLTEILGFKLKLHKIKLKG